MTSLLEIAEAAKKRRKKEGGSGEPEG